MLQPIVDLLEKLATDFSWARVLVISFFITFLGIVLLLYESQTSTFQLAKYERTVAILEKVESLRSKNSDTIEIVKNINQGLYRITEESRPSISFKTNFSFGLKQAFYAAFPWLIFTLFYIPGLIRGQKAETDAAVGVVALALITAVIGYLLIPKSWPLWIYPVSINILIFFVLMWIGLRNRT